MNKTIKYDKDIRDAKLIKEKYGYLIDQLNEHKKDIEKKTSNENGQIMKAKLTNVELAKKLINSMAKFEKRAKIINVLEAFDFPIDLDENVYNTKQDEIQVNLELLEMEKQMRLLRAKQDKLKSKTAKFNNDKFEEALEESEHVDDEIDDTEEKELSSREQYYQNLRNN